MDEEQGGEQPLWITDVDAILRGPLHRLASKQGTLSGSGGLQPNEDATARLSASLQKYNEMYVRKNRKNKVEQVENQWKNRSIEWELSLFLFN